MQFYTCVPNLFSDVATLNNFLSNNSQTYFCKGDLMIVQLILSHWYVKWYVRTPCPIVNDNNFIQNRYVCCYKRIWCSASLTIYLTTLKQEEVMIDIYRDFMPVSGTYNLETTARTLVHQLSTEEQLIITANIIRVFVV